MISEIKYLIFVLSITLGISYLFYYFSFLSPEACVVAGSLTSAGILSLLDPYL